MASGFLVCLAFGLRQDLDHCERHSKDRALSEHLCGTVLCSKALTHALARSIFALRTSQVATMLEEERKLLETQQTINKQGLAMWLRLVWNLGSSYLVSWMLG